MRIFVTGGAGYIGSHATVELLRKGYEVCIFDNFSNSSRGVLQRIELASNRKPILIEGDINSETDLRCAFRAFRADAVIHFAGLKSVSESVLVPEKYYNTNVGGTSKLLCAMTQCDISRVVFSSSATVYGKSTFTPYVEETPTNPISPYGSTKLACEELIQHWVNSSPKNKGICLRYFNPVGADKSGLIGEDFERDCANLLPVILQVLTGARQHLEIFGNDYDTRDGTGVRDYVHVTDLALAHISALEKIDSLNAYEVFNLGTGAGTTVLELLRTFEQVTKQTVPVKISSRRDGDVDISFADTSKAKQKLGLTFQRNIKNCVEDAWNWALYYKAAMTNVQQTNFRKEEDDER